MKKRAAILLPILFASSALGCPAVFEASRLTPTPAGERRDLRLFVISSLSTGRSWTSVPVQVDPLDDTGALLVPEPGEDPDSGRIAPHDRISVLVESFGLPKEAGDPPPCKAKWIKELRTEGAPSRYAYLALCPRGTPHAPGGFPVSHDKKQHRLQSRLFDYIYQPNNHFVFKRMTMDGSKAGADASMLVNVDVKNFMTLQLANDDVTSYVMATHKGPIGYVGRIQFFLKVLGLKLDLEMATTASWYADSANLPMVLDVPLTMDGLVNPGTGVLFDWLPEGTILEPQNPETTFPKADPKIILKGREALARQGLEHCPGDPCVYRLAGHIGDRRFFVDASVPRSVVQRGFFPSYVTDVPAFTDALDWGGGKRDDDERIAVYFDSSAMKRGLHRIDFWISFANQEAGQDACPAPLQF